MSERPNFAGVLAEHRIYGFNGTETACHCSMRKWRNGSAHRAHLAAALNAEVDRWLADEGTREAVVFNLRAAGFWGTHSDRWSDRDWQDEFWNTLGKSALAALTTETDPNGASE